MDLSKEKALVQQARKDPEAFGKIYDVYYDPIFNYCLRRTSHKVSAEDLTGEIFFKALNGLWKFRWQNVPFSAWLFKIAHNEVVNFYRKNQFSPDSLDTLMTEQNFDLSGGQTAAQNVIEREVLDEQLQNFITINKHLMMLPFKYREVLSLRYIDKKQVLEIAQILGKPEGTIKSLLSRGVQQLRDEMLQPKPDSEVTNNRKG